MFEPKATAPHLDSTIDRDRGDTSRRHPSHTTGHTGPYHGGSIGLSVGRNVEAGGTEAGEIRVGQRRLGGRMSGHAPKTGRRAGGNRRVELWQATLSQFFEAVGAVLPLPPEVRS